MPRLGRTCINRSGEAKARRERAEAKRAASWQRMKADAARRVGA